MRRENQALRDEKQMMRCENLNLRDCNSLLLSKNVHLRTINESFLNEICIELQSREDEAKTIINVLGRDGRVNPED